MPNVSVAPANAFCAALKRSSQFAIYHRLHSTKRP